MDTEIILKNWKKKTIRKSELEKLFNTESEVKLFELIENAVVSGILTPVKSSGTNGNRTYTIYLKYRLTFDNDYSDVLSEISMLHPSVIKNGYLQSRPEMYLQYKQQLQKLNRYLFKTDSFLSMSKKERSFEIFDEEKQFEDISFRSLLDHLDLTKETLCYYDTPEYCFNDYIPKRNDRMTLLICENKDIWFNIRRRMYEDSANSIFGVRIDGVVYGCGNKVSERGALSEYTRFMDTESVQYLYWGDIDRAGLNIYLSLIKNNPDISVQLFVPAYEEMLNLAEKRNIPDSTDNRERIGDYSCIYQLFTEESKNRLTEYITDNKRIPQEIINYVHLLRIMG